MAKLTGAMKYITRLDHESIHHWRVKIGRQDINRPKWAISKIFTDGVYSSKHKALQAAKKYRDKQAKKLKHLLPTVNGWRECWIEKRNGYAYLFIHAYYTDKTGKQIGTNFGVHNCGWDNAMKKMLVWRSKGIREKG